MKCTKQATWEKTEFKTWHQNENKTRKTEQKLTAFLALQTQSDFLGNLGLLVEDGLGLIAEYEYVGDRRQGARF
jgi:hypothetical protein